MRNVLIGAVAAASLAATAVAAEPSSSPQLIFGVDRADQTLTATPVQFFYSGQQYCWYPGGWRGPGFYYCGFAFRQGLGWGGPVGWMGYSFRGGNYWHGGAIYRGGGYRGGFAARSATGRWQARDASARVGGGRQGGAGYAGRGGGGGDHGGGGDRRP
jgi:hypothetical protein